jgi:hypothetical protein
MNIVQINRRCRAIPRARQCRQQQSGKDCDNRNHNQQFNQRETYNTFN